MPKLSHPVQAVLLMLTSMLGFAAMNTIIRLLAHTMHPAQMVLIRNVLSFLLIIAWSALLQRRRPTFRTQRISGHVWRASIGILAMEMWFLAVTLMPLTTATALSFTTPIFATIFAIFFLSERPGLRRWSAIATGFLGMLIILRPETDGIPPTAVLVLASSVLMALTSVLVKRLTRTEPPETIVFYMSMFMIPWSIPPAVYFWGPVTGHQMALLFLVALFSTLAHLTLTRAYMRAEMATLMPLDFTRLVFVAIFAYLLFGETLDAHTVAGSLVIVASAVYIARRERQANLRARAAAVSAAEIV